MKVRKRIILPVITVLMISTMLSGCGKSKVTKTETIQPVTAQTDSDIALERSAIETLNTLDEIAEDITEDSPEETTQRDSAGSHSEISTDGEPLQEKDSLESEAANEEPDIEAPYVEPDTEAPYVEPEPEQEDHSDFVADLSISRSVNQMIVVSANGSGASVSMHEIQNGTWTEIMSTSGYVGQQGVGSAREDAPITPAGIFSLSIAFGVNSSPGTSLPYTKVDDSYYWVDDSDSSYYYNRFVSTKNVAADWNSAEHIIDYPKQYAYVIAIDYNKGCVPGAGSAIFLHCSNGNATAGCVAISEDQMIFILNHIHSGCVIVIDTENNISNY